MSERKINLEEILLVNIKKVYTELKPVEDFCQRDRIISINAMKEACRQIVELVAENAELNYGEDEGQCITIDKQSILDTIKQIE